MSTSDEGVYEAIARSEIGSSVSEGTLTVNPARLKPYFIIPPPYKIPFRVNDTQYLTVKLGGVPVPNVYVVKKDNQTILPPYYVIYNTDKTMEYKLKLENLQVCNFIKVVEYFVSVYATLS